MHLLLPRQTGRIVTAPGPVFGNETKAGSVFRGFPGEGANAKAFNGVKSSNSSKAGGGVNANNNVNSGNGTNACDSADACDVEADKDEANNDDTKVHSSRQSTSEMKGEDKKC